MELRHNPEQKHADLLNMFERAPYKAMGKAHADESWGTLVQLIRKKLTIGRSDPTEDIPFLHQLFEQLLDKIISAHQAKENTTEGQIELFLSKSLAETIKFFLWRKELQPTPREILLKLVKVTVITNRFDLIVNVLCNHPAWFRYLRLYEDNQYARFQEFLTTQFRWDVTNADQPLTRHEVIMRIQSLVPTGEFRDSPIAGVFANNNIVYAKKLLEIFPPRITDRQLLPYLLETQQWESLEIILDEMRPTNEVITDVSGRSMIWVFAFHQQWPLLLKAIDKNRVDLARKTWQENPALDKLIKKDDTPDYVSKTFNVVKYCEGSTQVKILSDIGKKLTVLFLDYESSAFFHLPLEQIVKIGVYVLYNSYSGYIPARLANRFVGNFVSERLIDREMKLIVSNIPDNLNWVVAKWTVEFLIKTINKVSNKQQVPFDNLSDYSFFGKQTRDTIIRFVKTHSNFWPILPLQFSRVIVTQYRKEHVDDAPFAQSFAVQATDLYMKLCDQLAVTLSPHTVFYDQTYQVWKKIKSDMNMLECEPHAFDFSLFILTPIARAIKKIKQTVDSFLSENGKILEFRIIKNLAKLFTLECTAEQDQRAAKILKQSYPNEIKTEVYSIKQLFKQYPTFSETLIRNINDSAKKRNDRLNPEWFISDKLKVWLVRNGQLTLSEALSEDFDPKQPIGFHQLATVLLECKQEIEFHSLVVCDMIAIGERYPEVIDDADLQKCYECFDVDDFESLVTTKLNTQQKLRMMDSFEPLTPQHRICIQAIAQKIKTPAIKDFVEFMYGDKQEESLNHYLQNPEEFCETLQNNFNCANKKGLFRSFALHFDRLNDQAFRQLESGEITLRDLLIRPSVNLPINAPAPK